MIKKYLSVLTAVSLSLVAFTGTCLGRTNATDKETIEIVSETEQDDIIAEELIPYKYEKHHDFTYESVLIVLKKEYSELNKKWDISDFSVDNTIKVEDLTYMDNTEEEQKKYLEQVDFHQILRIYLEEQSFDNVINAIESFEKNDYILSAEPNFTFEECSTYPNDSSLPQNYYAFEKTKLYDAWDITTGSSNVKVGIIDSGIADVSDLRANVDYSLGYDFYNNNNITSDDAHGHGTMVASVVGAVGNNSIGMCGVCWNVKLVPLQVWGGGVAEWIEAITYAETNNIRILNLSYTINGTQNSLYYSINDYTGLLVCSAGNNGRDYDNSEQFYPVCLSNYNIITVASSTNNDLLSDFSCYGSNSVDLAAPGSSVRVITTSGAYGYANGTSFSSPMVAGTAALLLSYNPNLTPLEIKEVILNSVDHISTYEGHIFSQGRLNVFKALQYVKNPNQVQNIVIAVDKIDSNPINYFNFRITYNKKYQEYVSTVNGNINTTGITLNGADLLKWKYYTYYSGSYIPAVGNLFTCRFKTNVNSKKDVFSNTITISNPYNLSYTIAVIGDINDDGFVNSTDSNLVQQYVLNLTTFDSRQMISADVNFNGVVDMADAVRIIQYNSGTINSFF